MHDNLFFAAATLHITFRILRGVIVFFSPLFPLICLFLPFSGDLMLPPGHDMRVISSIEFFCFNLARGLG